MEYPRSRKKSILIFSRYPLNLSWNIDLASSMFNSSKSKALITPHTIVADNFAMRSRNQERRGQVMYLGGWLLDSYRTLKLLQKPAKEHDSSSWTMSRQSRQIYIYICTSIHALVPNGLLYEVRAHEWHCKQKWGTENTYVNLFAFLLFGIL
jgi:hypothetical protein